MNSIAEHLNAEICRGVLYDVPSAIFWLKTTYFWVRFTKNPENYPSVASAGCSPETVLRQLCVEKLRLLSENGFVHLDEHDEISVRACGPGMVLAK